MVLILINFPTPGILHGGATLTSWRFPKRVSFVDIMRRA